MDSSGEDGSDDGCTRRRRQLAHALNDSYYERRPPMRQAAWIAAGGVQVCNRRGWRSRPAARAFAPLFTMGGADGGGMLAVGTVLVVSVLVHGARAVSRRTRRDRCGKGDINQPLVTSISLSSGV